MILSHIKSNYKYLKKTQFPFATALGAGLVTMFFTCMLMKSSSREKAGPQVIDAEYAGYREKVSDYPNRNQGGKSIK